MKITEDIYRVDGIKGVNSYIASNGGKTVIIDTGFPNSSGKILAQLKVLGLSLQSVEHIILTHYDLDHTGGAAKLRAATGAKVAIHEGDALVLKGKERTRKISVKGFRRLLFFIKRKTIFRTKPIEPDILLKDGDELSGFKVVHTPGHTFGSICLHGKGALFAGDSLNTGGAGEVNYARQGACVDFEMAKESVRKLAGLEFSVLLPGHGEPVRGKAKEKFHKLIS